jgi:hypothetical protein
MKFDELSERAQQCAIENAQQQLSDWFDGQWVTDEWRDILVALGFWDVNIYWSGFCSQGDGACFTGLWDAGWVEPDKLAQYISPNDPDKYGDFAQRMHGLCKLLATADDGESNSTDDDQELPIVYRAKLTHRGRYNHENCIDFEVEPYGDDEVRQEFIEWCKDLMRTIYKDLEETYECETSEESAREYIAGNELDFDEDGNTI